MGDRTMPPPPRGAANPRKKFAVKPGFSMLDWNLLKTRANNLAGRDAAGMRGITKAEVRKHNSQYDCWSIFRGKVYNLTPFLHYHPGGVAEILKGAGRDCTALFDKYHPWVNFDTLVGNLYLGPLVSEKKLAAEQAKAEDADRSEKGEGEDEDKDSNDSNDRKAEEEEEGEGAGGSGGSGGDVEGTTTALEQMSATGREELARSESAGTDA